MASERTEEMAAALFAGPGETRALGRAVDWAATPLGAVASWPPALRGAVRLVLNAPGAMCLYVGPTYAMLYNDAFGDILGVKQPAALGRPAAEVLTELWLEFGPQLATIRAGGSACDLHDVPFRLERLDGGAAEEAWFDYALSAIEEEGAGGAPGAVVAILSVVTETTARLRAERALDVERERLRAVVLSAPAPMALHVGPAHLYELVNDAYRRISAGGRDVTGLPVREAFPEFAGQGIFEAIDRVYATGEGWGAPEVPIRYDRDGTGLQDTWFDLRLEPLRDAQGRVAGVLNFSFDVTDQVRARREVERLLAESEQARAEAEAARSAAEHSAHQLEDQAAELELQAEELQATAMQLEERTEEAEAAQRAAEAERARATSILEATSDAYFALDAEYRIVAVNAAMETGSGLSRDVLLGQVFWDAFPGTLGTAFEQHYRAAATDGDTAHFEHDYSDGRLDLVVSVDVYPAAGGIAVFWRDITERVRIGAERERLLADAQAARAEAEAANQAKSEFLAVMSHEIRTPINAMIGYSDLLDLGVAGTLTATQQGYVERIRASSDHLLVLINDVLDLAKVDAGQMEVRSEESPIGEAVTAARDLVLPQAAAKGIRMKETIECGPEATYCGDEARVRQIVVNLLSNAVKFTPPGGHITLRCSLRVDALPGGGAGPEPWMLVEVADTGMGMDADVATRVFDAFVQGESGHTRTAGGTGLGLTISRQFARLMGGDVTVESTPGEGSRFTLWLPGVEHGAEQQSDTLTQKAQGWRTALTQVTGLAPVGRLLPEESERIGRELQRRLRVDPEVPHARDLDDAQLGDHTPAFIAALGKMLVGVDEGHGETAYMDDTEAILNLIATRHGRQRHRLGWTRAELVREYQILHDLLNDFVRAEPPVDVEGDPEAALVFLHRLLDAAGEVSLAAYDGAQTGGGLDNAAMERVRTVMARSQEVVRRSRSLSATSEADLNAAEQSTHTIDEIGGSPRDDAS